MAAGVEINGAQCWHMALAEGSGPSPAPSASAINPVSIKWTKKKNKNQHFVKLCATSHRDENQSKILILNQLKRQRIIQSIKYFGPIASGYMAEITGESCAFIGWNQALK